MSDLDDQLRAVGARWRSGQRDPAVDLAAAWWLFEPEHHAALWSAYGGITEDLWLRSSFDDGAGTRIEEAAMEGGRVTAITHRKDVSVVLAEGTSGGRGEARNIIASVAERHPELELIAHEQATDAHGAIAWIGEHAHAALGAGRTTAGTFLDTVLTVYTGTVLTNLTQVAQSDNFAGSDGQSRVQFTASAGTRMRLRCGLADARNQ